MSSGTAFLAKLGPRTTQRLLSAGAPVELQPGARLIRRGEKGGDIYVIESGTLEIVDDRFHPEVVLDWVAAGDVVGDMTFLDQEPRSADVRASTPARCVHIPRDALQKLLDQDSEISAAFYRALAERMADRHRDLTAAASLGALGRRRSGSSALPWLSQQAGELAARARARWSQASAGRWTGSADAALAEVEAATQTLAEEASTWLERCGEHREEAGLLLTEELQRSFAATSLGPYLATPGRALQRGLRALALDEKAQHRPSALEHSLLGLPTFVQLRQQHHHLHQELADIASSAPPTSSLLLCVNPEKITLPGERLIVGGADCDGATVVEVDLRALIEGRQRLQLDLVDCVVVDGLLEHLPDRLVVQTLQWVGQQSNRGATLLQSQLPPTPDAAFVADVLGWRSIRRSPEQLQRLIQAAGLHPGRRQGGILRVTL